MKDVIINIKGTQFTEGAEGEVIELTTIGRMGERDGKVYLTYKEDSMAFGQDITTTLKIEREELVTMQRTGGNYSRLIIQKGQRHMSNYDTEYGNIMIGVFGEKINNQLRMGVGCMSLAYTIDVNCNMISRNELEITVKEAGNQS